MVGAVAQLGEHLLCKQGVSGSIPLSSTNRGTRFGCVSREYPSEEIKVCIVLLRIDACSEYIVKRRYVWKLPGVLSPCGLKRPSPVPEKP